jgi:hypothetical protein
MYFLRRRHGRKPPPEARRDAAPLEPQPPYPESEEVAPPKPVVITKAKRPRITSPEDDECKPAGTFRSGTLHIAHGGNGNEHHGKV